MQPDPEIPKYYLHAGTLFAHPEPHIVNTVLGSCVSVCLWDRRRAIGGINHYQLALWNGIGLASPKYGNVAILRLLDEMENLGCRRADLGAKVFGGGAVLQTCSGPGYEVGQRNIRIALDTLESQKIPILASDVGGTTGRRIFFYTGTGDVYVRKIFRPAMGIR